MKFDPMKNCQVLLFIKQQERISETINDNVRHINDMELHFDVAVDLFSAIFVDPTL